MLEIFKLIRLRTIAFAAFTMYAMRYFVIMPILEKEGFSLQVSEGDFSLLVLAVCCLVSAAYVINDYFDTKADRISGSKQVIVGKTISRRTAITLHTLLNVVAVAIAYYLAHKIHHSEIVLLFLAISAILWFYSSRIKKYFIWGNICVAFMASLIPLTAITFEIPLLKDVYSDVVVKTHVGFASIFYWTLWYSYLLFLNMLIYEINKDVYSVNGDQAEGITTIPVKWGVPATRTLLTGLAMLALASVCTFCYLKFWDSPLGGVYIAVFLIIPYVGYGLIVKHAHCMKFQLRLIRWLMVLCMLSSFFVLTTLK